MCTRTSCVHTMGCLGGIKTSCQYFCVEVDPKYERITPQSVERSENVAEWFKLWDLTGSKFVSTGEVDTNLCLLKVLTLCVRISEVVLTFVRSLTWEDLEWVGRRWWDQCTSVVGLFLVNTCTHMINFLLVWSNDFALWRLKCLFLTYEWFEICLLIRNTKLYYSRITGMKSGVSDPSAGNFSAGNWMFFFCVFFKFLKEWRFRRMSARPSGTQQHFIQGSYGARPLEPVGPGIHQYKTQGQELYNQTGGGLEFRDCQNPDASDGYIVGPNEKVLSFCQRCTRR